MTQAIYIASPEGRSGRNAVALAVVDSLARSGENVVVLRPVAPENDALGRGLASVAHPDAPREALANGVTARDVRADPLSARSDVMSAVHRLVRSASPDVIVAVGTDGPADFLPDAFRLDCAMAADLGAHVLLVICTRHRSPGQLRSSVDSCLATASQEGSSVTAIVVTGCADDGQAQTRTVLADIGLPVWIVPPTDVELGDTSSEEAAIRLVRSIIPSEDIVRLVASPISRVMTPVAFQQDLIHRASLDRRRIVLPESGEERILRAADYLLAHDIVDVTLLGDRDEIMDHAGALGLTCLGGAEVVPMDDAILLPALTDRLCELRARKGMTPAQARELLARPNYYGTMLVETGRADGLVSGSITSTADTVRPALQIIRTRPDASGVSGAFIMCLPDHPVLFADCAIMTNPNAEQLADIAIQSAHTARAFGIEPRVGMLSYSTLGSGSGPDVDLVTEATRIVALRSPDLPVVGPIQFDAAWSPTVAATKARGNEVAGHVTVFAFPDLSAGNIAYKAVQRSSGALAIGPVLQGLNSPVNDLSRGASVKDIINTIALTAITAQH
ncbi:phosphate acetyltransferase [uncultured Bifidobacterium sp.]|uniref:phosphate acetyltransferase n=1 Tax=uncultured Bifidobacterium sp. TaxID=165187 RepID=UPI0028DB3508|nr:phosphate acetyltransferase [uncultured Bifidobacterium sp.]